MADTLSRAKAVLADAWRRLPRAKLQAHVRRVALKDLGMIHGRYDPQTGILELNRAIFDGRLIDDQGGGDPYRKPYATRALHTTIHELSHAIGDATGLDRAPEWLALSGWVRDPWDRSGYGRYVERRPGWEWGPSEWRYKHGSWFAREYSSKSPFEDAADVITYIALGWSHVFTGRGKEKYDYMMHNVWDRKVTASDRNWSLFLASRSTLHAEEMCEL